MMMSSIIAHDGETVEGAIHRAAGLGRDAIMPVLTANPRLCERVTLLAGDIIHLPISASDQPPNQNPSRVALWD